MNSLIRIVTNKADELAIKYNKTKRSCSTGGVVSSGAFSW